MQSINIQSYLQDLVIIAPIQLQYIFIPHVSDVIMVMGVIVLASSVCECICLSVCPSQSPSSTDGHKNLYSGMDVKWKDI